ncbi:MAG: GGDEF domain-containing protein [Xanthobacteraceae bacterium]
MSKHGPILAVVSDAYLPLVAGVRAAGLDSVVQTDWPNALQAFDHTPPAAVIAAAPAEGDAVFKTLATRIAATQPYVPLIMLDAIASLPINAIPFSLTESSADRLVARLRAALRIRALHATMLRRQIDQPSAPHPLPVSDPLQDATILLVGRGASYPALSVALGAQMGVVGALSVEAAAKHLNLRDIDGIVIGDGFTARVVDAFLTVLSEDPRFRNLPVVAPSGPERNYDLPNLETINGEPALIVATVLPLIRQRAFEQRIHRTLRSIDAGGLLDPRTGLLTPAAFSRDFSNAVKQAQARRAGLSAARFAFAERHSREQYDAARILGRLMRRTDFATMHDDGSMTAVFVDAGARNASTIAKRLASVMKYTMHSARRGSHIDPHVRVETLTATDTAASLLARLAGETKRAAS